MYYNINGKLGKVIEFLETPARQLFNREEGRENTISGLALFALLGVPAFIGISLTRPIYWVAGDKIKEKDYDKEKKAWQEKLIFASEYDKEALIGCLIRSKIKTEDCIYTIIRQLDYERDHGALFYSFHKEGALKPWRDGAADGKIKVLGIMTFRSTVVKSRFEKEMRGNDRLGSYPSPLALKRKFYQCKNIDTNEPGKDLRSLTERAISNTEFMVLPSGDTSYPTEGFQTYLKTVMTQSTELKIDEISQE